MNDYIHIIPLGGCGEIGMNMTIFGVGSRYFFIDGGALFPDMSNIGVDLIIPSTRFLDDNEILPEAWLITHGHEDHIGALVYLFRKYPAPIYATQFTIELIKAKFLEAGIVDVEFFQWVYFKPTLFRNFKVTPFPVNHSIADASGFFLETPFGNVLHMGDFRIDYNPPEKTMTHENVRRAVGSKTVALMMSDSTNSFQQGTDKSEMHVYYALETYLNQSAGAVVVATFASNIWRMQTIFDAALKADRKIVLFGRTMLRNAEIGKRIGMLNYPDDLLVPVEQVHQYKKNKICILSTGSQGEVFAGLHRLAWNNFANFQLDANDKVIFSSRVIPGNEKPIDALITQLSRMGCDVITARENSEVHVSGHAYQEDLTTCIKMANPKAFMPVHGTYRHLRKHIELAVSMGVPRENCFLVENGGVLEIRSDAVEIIDTITSGRDYVCPGGVFDQNSFLYKDRLALAKTGLVAVSLMLQKKTFKITALPGVSCRGIPMNDQELAKRLMTPLENTVAAFLKRKKSSVEILEDDLRLSTRRVVENLLNFKTTVVVLLHFV